MNMEFVKKLENVIQSLKRYDGELRNEYKKEGKTVSEKNSIVATIKKVDSEYLEATKELEVYKTASEEKRREIEDKYISRYRLNIKRDEVEELPEELSIEENKEDKEEAEEVVAVEKPKTGLRILSYIGIAGLAGGIGYGLASCSNKNAEVLNNETEVEDLDVDTETVEEEPELKPGEPGTFKDASNEDEINARVDWYFENYFDKEYSNLTDVEKDSINKENLADMIKIVNGELIDGFEMNELVNYDNKLTQMFSTYLSTLERAEANNVGFIPSQYLYEDGSHEQKCAAEVDAVMEPLIEAINKHDDEAFKKYATEFGELMRDQYYYPDAQATHYNVRSIASYPSRMHLYGLSYSQYVANILEYGIVNNIDVCIPFCFDNDGYVEEIPLSKLMATLDFVPMGEWEYVLKRAGMTSQEIASYGNNAVEDTMFQRFLKDAKNHYSEKLNQQMTLTPQQYK